MPRVDFDHDGDKEEHAEAFRLLTKYQPRLVSDDEMRKHARRGIPLPKTLQEMLARKTMKR